MSSIRSSFEKSVKYAFGKIYFLIFLIFLLLLFIPFCIPKPVLPKPTQTIIHQRPLYQKIHNVTNTPEFRQMPLKRYNPDNVQQVGVLINDDGQTMPLFGKRTHRHRYRFNYYTNTTGNQIYPIPVFLDNKDAMSDLGINELFGEEQLSVLGKPGIYKVVIYNNLI